MSSIHQRVVLIRHGETTWARDKKHTGRTNIPLTDLGRQEAARLRPILAEFSFKQVYCSPLVRAVETCQIAGLGQAMKPDEDLLEWDYGAYEGRTTEEIRSKVPGWTVFTHPCPGGEASQEVAMRCDRVIARVRGIKGDVALFAHGHILRVLAARWLGMEARAGAHWVLDTSTLNILGYEHETPALLCWNGPTRQV